MRKLTQQVVLLLSIFALVFSCEKEDDFALSTKNTITSSAHLKPYIVYGDEIERNQKLSETLLHLKELQCKSKEEVKSNLNNKLVFNETLNITIDDESAMYMENADGSYHSYTFQAIDHEHPYGVQNVVLSLLPNGNYLEVLVRYEVEGDEEIAFRNGETIDLTGKVSYAVLENGSFTSALSSKVTTIDQCITIVFEQAGKRCTSTLSHSWDERNQCNLYPGPNGPSPYIAGSVNIDYACIDSFYTETGGTPPSGWIDPNDDGTVNDGSVTTVPYVSPAELARRAAFVSILSEENRTWLNGQPDDIRNHLFNYLESQYNPALEGDLDPNSNSDSFYSQETIDFVIELIDVIKEDAIVDSNALGFVLEAKKQDKIFNDFDADFLNANTQYFDLTALDIAENTDPIYFHYSRKVAILRVTNPDWSWRKVLWEASKDLIHISLDVFGLIPVVGEVADITNGVLYTIEGDGVNATLSYASAIPFVGWATTGTKYAFKVVNVAYDINTKTKLVWKLLPNGLVHFGSDGNSRKVLRKVLGIVGNTTHAHHIIPLSLKNQNLVQKAAKSSSAFHINELINGVALPSSNHLTGHHLYNTKIYEKLELLYTDGMSLNEAYDALHGFVVYLKNLIEANPNLNLGQIADLINYP